ncbi:MAG: SDR family oxidoreductase [Chloroflexota bacterium]
MNFDFHNQTIVITGGNGYIGRAIGLSFAQTGADVILLGRNESKGAESVQLIHGAGHRAQFSPVDLGNATAVERFVNSLEKIDVLINCAGAGESRGGSVNIFVDGQTRDDLEQRWADLTDSNLKSAYLMSSLAAAKMSAGGSIINITSTASIHGNYGLYGTMKAGAEGLTRSLAVELAGKQIRVNAVSPGWIETPNTLPKPDDPNQQAWAAQTSLMGRMGRPNEIANACLFLASPLASFITGETLRVDGGLTIIDPTTGGWRQSIINPKS